MSKITIWISENRKIIIKSGSIQPDPQFLIIHGGSTKYKLPWANVICVAEEKEKS